MLSPTRTTGSRKDNPKTRMTLSSMLKKLLISSRLTMSMSWGVKLSSTSMPLGHTK